VVDCCNYTAAILLFLLENVIFNANYYAMMNILIVKILGFGRRQSQDSDWEERPDSRIQGLQSLVPISY